MRRRNNRITPEKRLMLCLLEAPVVQLRGLEAFASAKAQGQDAAQCMAAAFAAARTEMLSLLATPTEKLRPQRNGASP